jgi:hypothetical protein
MKRKAREIVTTMSDLLFGTDLILFPFWCLDSKGGEESIYLAIFVLFIVFYSDLACKTIIMSELVLWTWF